MCSPSKQSGCTIWRRVNERKFVMFNVTGSRCKSVKTSDHFFSLSLVWRAFTRRLQSAMSLFFPLLLVSGSLYWGNSCQVIIQHGITQRLVTTHTCCSCQEPKWSMCKLDRWWQKQTTCPSLWSGPIWFLPVPTSASCHHLLAMRHCNNSCQSSSKVEQKKKKPTKHCLGYSYLFKCCPFNV